MGLRDFARSLVPGNDGALAVELQHRAEEKERARKAKQEREREAERARRARASKQRLARKGSGARLF
ncbi:hypothetical protein [Streptomyces sp. CCM_MD2014]|uniref:hypothetical protein n=1 Tax=Streptomyces sp. CCM_MD2014 TaxID=1561022 RepID=UPI00052ABE0D|nr:hypothetical protein [Streptomyces sp. CCM_MD2014]AIV35576.1 hypothetical protein NI25_20445 [Streptomyces sp. CCM_MD2014]